MTKALCGVQALEKETVTTRISSTFDIVFAKWNQYYNIKGCSSLVHLCTIFSRCLTLYPLKERISFIYQEKFFSFEEIRFIESLLPHITRLLEHGVPHAPITAYLEKRKEYYTEQEQKYFFIIEDRINANQRDMYGNTPLHFLAAMGYGKNIEDFSKNAFIDIKNNNGQTPLHYAALYGQEEILLSLLKKGSFINAQCNQGLTALCYAVRNGHKNIIDILLKNNADITLKSSNKLTLLDESMQLLHYCSHPDVPLEKHTCFMNIMLLFNSLEKNSESLPSCFIKSIRNQQSKHSFLGMG